MKKDFVVTGAENRPISIDFRTSETGGNSLIIFVHGFKGFKDWGAHNLVADYFAKEGFNYLKFNFSHNGTTPVQPLDFADLEAFGHNTFSKELSDLSQVIDFSLSGKEFAWPEEIILLGHSRGGGISVIQTATDSRVKKLVTWASISDFRNLWKPEKEPEWKTKGVIYSPNTRTKQDMPLYIDLLSDLNTHPEEFSILKNASEINVPWLIVNGDSDESVSVEDARKLNNHNPASKLEIIANGNHVFNASHPYKEYKLPDTLKEVCDKTIRFLQTF